MTELSPTARQPRPVRLSAAAPDAMAPAVLAGRRRPGRLGELGTGGQLPAGRRPGDGRECGRRRRRRRAEPGRRGSGGGGGVHRAVFPLRAGGCGTAFAVCVSTAFTVLSPSFDAFHFLCARCWQGSDWPPPPSSRSGPSMPPLSRTRGWRPSRWARSSQVERPTISSESFNSVPSRPFLPTHRRSWVCIRPAAAGRAACRGRSDRAGSPAGADLRQRAPDDALRRNDSGRRRARLCEDPHGACLLRTAAWCVSAWCFLTLVPADAGLIVAVAQQGDGGGTLGDGSGGGSGGPLTDLPPTCHRPATEFSWTFH